MSPRPLWRWWLFCAALAALGRLKWAWLADVYAWAVLPEWLGWDGQPFPPDSGEVPF